MEKATKVATAISVLETKGTVATSSNIFKNVINTLRTNFSNLIDNKSISINYSNCSITLN